MGYMRHHAIIVTTHSARLIDKAHEKACAIFEEVTSVSDAAINGYRSFLVPPDGSKEGWEESDAGDAKRAEFIAWLNSQCHDDHSTPYKWAEVQYGDEDGDDRMLDSCELHRASMKYEEDTDADEGDA